MTSANSSSGCAIASKISRVSPAPAFISGSANSNGARACWGELNDLCVLEEAINDQCRDSLETTAPQFIWLLEQHRLHCWRRWRQLCEELMDSGSRRRRLAALARLGEGASIGRRWARALIDFPSRLR
jgi:hypothetical protein